MSRASAVKRSSAPYVLALALIFSALPACTALGQKAPGRVDRLLEALGEVRTPVTAAISPDGSYVAWTVSGKSGSELHLTGLAPTPPQDAAPSPAKQDRVLSPDTIADPTRLTPGACTAGHPAWSPSGLELAFLSDCNIPAGSKARPAAGTQDNIWVWTPATNAIRQVSHLHGNLSDLLWSPDGRYIGFLFVENATRHAGALDAMKPPSGVIGEDGVEVQRVYAVEVASGRGNWISWGSDLHVYEFAWAPNSLDIVFVGSLPPGENNWWTAKLYRERTGNIAFCEEIAVPNKPGTYGKMCRDDGPLPGPPELVFDPTTTPGPLHGLQIAVPRFSPDGKQIAFIGGLMSDQGSVGGDIYLVPSTGLEPGLKPDAQPGAAAIPKDLTPNRPASPAWIEWRNDHSLLVSEHVGGSAHITAIDTASGQDDPALNVTFPESIIAGFDVMSLSVAHNAGTQTSTAPSIALIRQSYDRPPEVWAGPLNDPGRFLQLSHLNDTLQRQWGKSESVEWTNDGFHLQGWLLYPANYDPAKKYPLVVNIHGGPSSAMMQRWPEATFGAQPFSALGYFVFSPNPRGSFGQGEKFTQANRKDFGYGDLRDILTGMDTLEKRFPIDRTRENVMGWSYGGFMTMFAVTQTTRFHAAVAGAGISNWLSYYGENSIDQWMLPFFGATVYEDPAVYAKSSPLTFIKNARTPTLILVGDRDGECPAPQSFEFWHALRAEGVKTQLVVYPNEGHHFTNAEHRSDVLRRALEWFDNAGNRE